MSGCFSILRDKLLALNQNQNQSDDHEADGNPLGPASQLGIPALGLVLGQEGIHAAADGTGDARALAGLEQHHEDQEQGGDDLSDRQNRSNNCHLSKSPFFHRPSTGGQL